MTKKKNEYGAESIQVLENIEAVRKRPGMYVGSTDEQGWHHLFQEVIDNSIDEAVAGYCSEVKIILSADQKTLTIEDNGRGIPIEIHPETKRSTLETIFTILHSGGKFDNKVYKTSGGLHGVGVTAVNALSEILQVWSKREGKTEFLEFKEGNLVTSQITDTPQEKNGIIICFTPDKKIFQEFTHFRIELIQSRLQELAYLNSNLTLIFQTSPQAAPTVYHFESGLAGWVQKINQGQSLSNSEVCAEEWTSLNQEEYFHLNFAWQYSQISRQGQIKSFCNNISTGGGGTHVEGFEAGFVSATREWIKEKNPQLKITILKEDILTGLVTLLAIRMSDPEFTGQTKDRLANKKVRELVRNVTNELVNTFFKNHPATAEIISRQIISNAQIRLKRVEWEELERGISQSRVELPEGLAPCISKETENNELFLVEGKSAGGSAKPARDPFNQAVLPVQGKIINVGKVSKEIKKTQKVLDNKEIRSLVSSLGFNVGEATQNYYNRFRSRLDIADDKGEWIITDEFIYQNKEGEEQVIPSYTPLVREQVETIVEKTKQDLLKKIRFGKVIIMADADPDGRHIECLALTLFARYFRYLIEDHRLYLAVPPLYRLQTKKEIKYFYSDYELGIYRQQNPNLTNTRLQRFKGLGEMNPQQLRETTMAVRQRCLHELLFSDAPATQSIIEDLMGIKSEQRKKLLESGAHKNAQLEIIDKPDSHLPDQERISQIEFGQALSTKFLEYSYAVVESRALPQLYDGLKPVQRRILYTLYELGLSPNKAHKKAAKIVGEVMGKYHPHGDSSIYQAMVKMAQDFSFRYPLVDGQGNWGSIDGDPAAAMRYTEARLSKFGSYLLADLAFETVEWTDNYDETEKEPKILPANLNLLLNGSSGIAVGMTTEILPHNLGEVVDSTINLIRNPNLTIAELLQTLPGPDFPTGGIILEKDTSNLLNIYEQGQGTIYIRAQAEILSSNPKGREDLIRITSLPYKVNKVKLVTKINQIIKSKGNTIEGLRSVADYSNWEKKVEIHCRFDPNYDGKVILNRLYQSTNLQKSISIKMRALVEEKPKIFNLKEILQGFVSQRLINIQKKASFIYQENEKALVNLQTRQFIIDNYQEIAEIARTSISDQEREQKLKTRFSTELEKLQEKLRTIQDKAADSSEKPSDLEQEAINRILDTPASFRQFTPEKREKLAKDIQEKQVENLQQRLLMEKEEVRKEELIRELERLKQSYPQDQRLTAFSSELRRIEARKLIPAQEERIILLSQQKDKKEGKTRSYLTIYNPKGEVIATDKQLTNQGGELPKSLGESWALMKLKRRDDLWCFSNYGRLYLVNFYKFNLINKSVNFEEYDSKGKPWIKFQNEQEYITQVLPISEEFSEERLVIITKKGQIKKWEISELKKGDKVRTKVIKLAQKKTQKCSPHQNDLAQHKINCCSQKPFKEAYLNCSEFRELQKKVKECADCQVKWEKKGDEIAQVVLAKKNEKLIVVYKKKDKNGQVKNFQTSAYQIQRATYYSEEFQRKLKKYCPQHQPLSEEHARASCCDKSQGIKVYSRCPRFQSLMEKIKACATCQNRQDSSLFSPPSLRQRIKGCTEVLDLLKVPPATSPEDLTFLLISQDRTCNKKPFAAAKSQLAVDNSEKITDYCKKHWKDIGQTQEELTQTKLSLRELKEDFLQEVLTSSLPKKGDKSKEEIIKTILDLAKLKFTKELEEKITNSRTEEMINEEVIANLWSSFQTRCQDYKDLLAKKNELETQVQSFAEKNKDCPNCQKYCKKHIDLKQKQDEEHKNCPHCGKKDREVAQIREEIKQVEVELKQKEQKTEAVKEVVKLKKKLTQKQEKVKELRDEVFANHRRCPLIQKWEKERKECKSCQGLKTKKHKKIITNPLRQVRLVNKQTKSEVYFLSKKSVLHSKENWNSFLTEGKSRKLWREITDLKVYSL